MPILYTYCGIYYHTIHLDSIIIPTKKYVSVDLYTYQGMIEKLDKTNRIR